MKTLGHLKQVRGVEVDEFPAHPWPFDPPEAASAVSEFGHDEPPRAQTVSVLQRIKRRLRALVIKRLRP